MAGKSVKKKNLSSLKRIRQADKANLTNRTVRTRIKNIKTKMESVVAEGNKEAIAIALKEAEKIIRTAASKGIIKNNNASRNVSRLTKRATSAVKAS